MNLIERVTKRLDPRLSVAARLLLAFALLWLVPMAVFVIVLQRRLTDLQESTTQRLSAVKAAEAAIRIGQDAAYRAEYVDRRVKLSEESAWVLADEARVLLEETKGPERRLPPPDAQGHIWNRDPEDDSLGYLMASRAKDPAALHDASRLGALAPAMRSLRERRPSVRAVSIWTASGVMRRSPWLDLHEAIKDSSGALEQWAFNRIARFPERHPATGDQPVWISSFVGPRLTSDVRTVGLLIPVRSSDGRLLAGLSLEMDARRFFIEAADAGEVQGDFYFALDGQGHSILMTSRAASLLKWRGDPAETLSDSADPGRQALAGALAGQVRTASEYVFDGKKNRVAFARVPETNWVFVEGLSAEALHRLQDQAEQEVQPERYRALKRDVILLFAYLFIVVLFVTWQLSRRISEPVEQLVRAAEDIGEGRLAELVPGSSRDELGRLASALESMSKRVERRVETLRRLHTLLRLTYRTTDMREVLARCAEAVAAFTRAERVIFFLHNADTNRLEAAWPGWNLAEDVAERLRIPVDSRSITGMVFRTGELYATNDLDHDPYAARALQQITGPTQSGVFVPLKTEDKTIGVAAAFNRPGGFGHEEVDAVTSFADAASLLITNARLYETLTGTVEELRRASRLKDQFLQNVNHELRTPLTSIVGWTDLLEEEKLDPETLRRGQRQVRQSARVLLALIDDLLDLARMDRGTLVLELKTVSLGDVAQRSLETVRMMAEAQGVALIMAPLPEDMPLIKADALRLQQVFWNLLTNAIKFTRRHGRVVVRLEREPDRYLVSVEDDGIGIPESELPHVFERFRQVDGSPTRRHSGMGIGLSLVRSLVELHGGTIWAESVVGHGSRFTFTLPIGHAERHAAPTSPGDADTSI